MNERFIAKLAQVAVGNETIDYAKGVGRKAAVITLGTGAIAGAGLGYAAWRAMDPGRAQLVAAALARKLRLPVAAVVALLAAYFAAKKVGLPLGLLVGAAAPSPPSRPNPDAWQPAPRTRIQYMTGE